MSGKYAVIDGAGIIEDGSYEELLRHWNDEKYMDRLLKKINPPLEGDLMLVKIMCQRH